MYNFNISSFLHISSYLCWNWTTKHHIYSYQLWTIMHRTCCVCCQHMANKFYVCRRLDKRVVCAWLNSYCWTKYKTRSWKLCAKKENMIAEEILKYENKSTILRTWLPGSPPRLLKYQSQLLMLAWMSKNMKLVKYT